MAVSEENSKWMEMLADDIDSCTGRDILTCLGAIAYRALAPASCASTMWLINNQHEEKNIAILSIKTNHSRLILNSKLTTANMQCFHQTVKLILPAQGNQRKS